MVGRGRIFLGVALILNFGELFIVITLVMSALKTLPRADNKADEDGLENNHSNSHPEPHLDYLRVVVGLVKLVVNLNDPDVGVGVGTGIDYLEVIEFAHVQPVLVHLLRYTDSHDRGANDESALGQTKANGDPCCLSEWAKAREAENDYNGNAISSERCCLLGGFEVSLRRLVPFLSRFTFSFAVDRPAKGGAIPPLDFVVHLGVVRRSESPVVR